MSKKPKHQRRKFIHYLSALLIIITLAIVITKELDHNLISETTMRLVNVHLTVNHELQEKDKVIIAEPMEDDTNMEPSEEMKNDEEVNKNKVLTPKEKEIVEKAPEQKKEEEKQEEQPKAPEGPFAFPTLEETIKASDDDAVPVITNPTSFLLIVNKERKLPEGFIPPDLTVPNVRFSFSGNDEKRYLRKEAADALESLFSAAEKDGVNLYAVSGYRSYNRQTTLFNHYVSTMGRSEAEEVSARPGTSEHQTGLAMDVSSKAMNFRLDQSFGNTKEGKWLRDNAYKYGYIIRYPQGKEPITGYTYEPWHLRYVGITAASYIQQFDLTLEEIAGKSF